MFCQNCGRPLNFQSNFCPFCGCQRIKINANGYATSSVPPPQPQPHFYSSQYSAPNPQYSPYYMQYPQYRVPCQKNIVVTVSQRMKTNAIIWIVIAAIQIIFGLLGNIAPLIIGILNLLSAISDIRTSKKFLSNPTGIVKDAKPLAGHIITLLYNFFIGGVIGVIGVVYYLVAIRGYVLENEQAFLEIEKEFNKS